MNSRFNPPRGMYPGHYPEFAGNYPLGPALSPREFADDLAHACAWLRSTLREICGGQESDGDS